MKFFSSEPFITEMATISKNVKLGNGYKRIAIHGPMSGDREVPHVHIYLADDRQPYNKFNFEISLVDILVYDEINLLKMRDESKGILKNNRTKCSWDGYLKLKRDFEDWLFNTVPNKPGEWHNNLDCIIYFYNEESYDRYNHILTYIENRGFKVLKKYDYLFSEEDKLRYKKVFE